MISHGRIRSIFFVTVFFDKIICQKFKAYGPTIFFAKYGPDVNYFQKESDQALN